jgi:hypothetical protein
MTTGRRTFLRYPDPSFDFTAIYPNTTPGLGRVYVGLGDTLSALTNPFVVPPGGAILALGVPNSVRTLAAARPRVSISDATVTPSAPGWVTMTFQVTLSAPSDRPARCPTRP